MLSTAELTEATIRVKQRSDKSVGWPLAAIKAIEAKNILHLPDVKKRKMEVLAELRKRGIIRAPKRRRHAVP